MYQTKQLQIPENVHLRGSAAELEVLGSARFHIDSQAGLHLPPPLQGVHQKVLLDLGLHLQLRSVCRRQDRGGLQGAQQDLPAQARPQRNRFEADLAWQQEDLAKVISP